MALDFTKPAGRRALERLAAVSDVFMQNFKPGSLERHGFGYDDLRRINPRIIYVTLTGYGPVSEEAATGEQSSRRRGQHRTGGQDGW